MDVEIAGRHVEVTETMDGHIRQQVDKLPRFADRVQHLTVTLEKAAGNLVVEIVAKSPRAEQVARAKGHDMYKAIDAAFAKLERQLARHHDKRVSGRAREAQQMAEDRRQPD